MNAPVNEKCRAIVSHLLGCAPLTRTTWLIEQARASCRVLRFLRFLLFEDLSSAIKADSNRRKRRKRSVRYCVG
jgi:hypothetical protein